MQRLPEMRDVWQETLGWLPNARQQKLFEQLYQEIILGNRQLNLTRIVEPTEFWEKHLWDSLRGVAHLGLARVGETQQPQSIIDIGTGAGFPGIPIAIAIPSFTVTLLDSTRKKIAFLQTLLTKLEIKNAIPLSGRAEEIGQRQLHREAYDLALVRAVATPSVCAEYALPLLKVGGVAVLYRGHSSDKEMNILQPAVEKLGGAIKSIEKFTTPLSTSVRHCIYLHKLSATPAQYPRAVGIPAQQPLSNHVT